MNQNRPKNYLDLIPVCCDAHKVWSNQWPESQPRKLSEIKSEPIFEGQASCWQDCQPLTIVTHKGWSFTSNQTKLLESYRPRVRRSRSAFQSFHDSPWKILGSLCRQRRSNHATEGE